MHLQQYNLDAAIVSFRENGLFNVAAYAIPARPQAKYVFQPFSHSGIWSHCVSTETFRAAGEKVNNRLRAILKCMLKPQPASRRVNLHC